MDEVEVCVHAYDESPCDRPPQFTAEPCGHGHNIIYLWVSEPPC
jgi:hypothetical protein